MLVIGRSPQGGQRGWGRFLKLYGISPIPEYQLAIGSLQDLYLQTGIAGPGQGGPGSSCRIRHLYLTVSSRATFRVWLKLIVSVRGSWVGTGR